MSNGSPHPTHITLTFTFPFPFVLLFYFEHIFFISASLFYLPISRYESICYKWHTLLRLRKVFYIEYQLRAASWFPYVNNFFFFWNSFLALLFGARCVVVFWRTKSVELLKMIRNVRKWSKSDLLVAHFWEKHWTGMEPNSKLVFFWLLRIDFNKTYKGNLTQFRGYFWVVLYIWVSETWLRFINPSKATFITCQKNL